MSWRYIAQRATTLEFLDWDVPLDRDELGWALSGAGVLRGKVSPDVGSLRAADGSLLLDEWGTLLYAESNGRIRWGGIVTKSRFEGAVWNVEAVGFAAYPQGIPYDGENWGGFAVDPLAAVRQLWTHVQSRQDGDLNVVVDSDTSPVRLGVPPTPAYQVVSLDGGATWVRKDSVDPDTLDPAATSLLYAAIDKDDTSLVLKTVDKFDRVTYPCLVTIGSETIQVGGRSSKTLTGLVRGYGTSTASGHSAGTKVVHKGTPEKTVAADPGEPYALRWYDAVDCGGEIDNLAVSTPFDYAEEHSWSDSTSTSISHRLRLGYPRLGTRRFDLAFRQGENVVSVVTPERDGDEFANVAIGLGAGEGSKTIRRTLATRDGRLRRPVVFSDKGEKSGTRLQNRLAKEFASHRNTLEVTSVDVVDHPNAPIASWQLGDDVLIEADIPWVGSVAVWSRVVGWSLLSDTTARLSLRRSDAFTYGRPPQ